MDIRFILRKFFIYVGLAIFVFLAYYATLWIDNNLFYGAYTWGSYLSAIFIVPLFLLGFSWFNRSLKRITNQYFFTGLYDYQDVVETFAKRISQTINLDEVVEVIISTVQNSLRVDNLAVAVADHDDQQSLTLQQIIGFNRPELEPICNRQNFCRYLRRTKQPVVVEEFLSERATASGNGDLTADAKLLKNIGVSLILPLTVKDNLNSLVVLGPKISKDAYTNEDLQLLVSIANQASIAIQNASLYQQVQDFNQTLQSKVNAQTHDIIAKNEQLERLLKAQSEFLDIASHQLRTPVSVIRGIVSMIQDGDMARLTKEKQEEFIESAAQKGAKLEQIISDILSASDLDSRKFSVDSTTPKIQLEDVVDRAVKGFKLEAEQRDTDLQWAKPVLALPLVIGNDSMLEQAVSNFISNALKYTPSTKMAKEARATRSAPGRILVSAARLKNDIVVSVKDNGIGIPKDEMKKLFTKFTRASNATAMYTDGSGLGLFIIKEIIEGHKGRVWLESVENKGSTFFFSLPIAGTP